MTRLIPKSAQLYVFCPPDHDVFTRQICDETNNFQVPPTDDDMPVDTIRAWVIGGVLCTIVSACNVLLALRRTPIAISSTVVQLVAYPYVIQQ